MKKILEVEGGFIAKEYDEAGSVTSTSEVFPTREEAEAGKLNEVDPIEEAEVEAPTAPAEEVPAPEAPAPEGEEVKAEGAEPVAETTTEAAPEGTEAAPAAEEEARG